MTPTSGDFNSRATVAVTLFFDDGWHKLSTALWLFGPVKEVRAWIGTTEIIPGIELDAPTTVIWEHENGVRGVWDVTLAVDMYLRSDYYTNDERWEVTGRRGFARVNRCTGRGIQEPSLEIYLDGEMRSFHALDDDWASSFRDSGRHWIETLRTGDGPLLWGAEEALDVLRFALAAYESSAKRRNRRRNPSAMSLASQTRGSDECHESTTSRRVWLTPDSSRPRGGRANSWNVPTATTSPSSRCRTTASWRTTRVDHGFAMFCGQRFEVHRGRLRATLAE